MPIFVLGGSAATLNGFRHDVAPLTAAGPQDIAVAGATFFFDVQVRAAGGQATSLAYGTGYTFLAGKLQLLASAELLTANATVEFAHDGPAYVPAAVVLLPAVNAQVLNLAINSDGLLSFELPAGTTAADFELDLTTTGAQVPKSPVIEPPVYTPPVVVLQPAVDALIQNLAINSSGVLSFDLPANTTAADFELDLTTTGAQVPASPVQAPPVFVPLPAVNDLVADLAINNDGVLSFGLPAGTTANDFELAIS